MHQKLYFDIFWCIANILMIKRTLYLQKLQILLTMDLVSEEFEGIKKRNVVNWMLQVS